MIDEVKDEIKDVIDEFKARLHSPLFGSFIIAWLCINWYIPVSLIFYKQNELCLDGYSSYKELIWAQSNLCNALIWPSVLALIYTFGYPYLRAKITKHLTKIDIDSQNELVIIREALHSHKKIVTELNNKYNLLEELRIKADNDLQTTQLDLIKANKDLAEVNQKWLDVEKELSYQINNRKRNNDVNELSFFTGIWELTYEDPNVQPRLQRWNISQDKIFSDNGNGAHELGSIYNATYYDKQLAFTFQATNTNIFSTFVFVTNDAVNHLTGIDDRGRRLTMRRIEL